jgi:HEPN domain-containing protein
MKSITREWVDKAEADFATAERESSVLRDPNFDAVCFHSQQSAEKLLKARLQEANIAFVKTHDLSFLLDLVLFVEPTWTTLRSELEPLTAYAVEYRYPGQSADQSEAIAALEACRKVRSAVRRALGLEASQSNISN